MEGVDALKSYLVKLGFDVDNEGFNKLKNTLNDISSIIAKNSSEMKQQYVEAGAAIVGAITSVTGAITSLATKVAESDMTFQLFAQRMYMSNEMAKAFKITTDALGHSLNEIAWNPELRHHYFELLKEVKSMQVPGAARETYEQLRSVGFEWTRLKVEAVSSIDWIVFHLIKMNHGELSNFKGSLSFINDKIQKNMPEWTNNVAKFLNPFVAIGKDIAIVFSGVLRVFGGIFGFLEKGWEKMPFWERNIVSFQTFLLALFTAGAVGGKAGAFIKGLTLVASAILILDDAIAHFQGRLSHSWLEPLWEGVEIISHTVVKLFTMISMFYDTLGKLSIKSSKKEIQDAFKNFDRGWKAFSSGYDEAVAEDWAKRNKSKQLMREQQKELPGNDISLDSYSGQIKQSAIKYGVSEELIKSVIKRESGGNPNAISSAGAIGMMQVMPGTAKLYGVSRPDLYDWRKNIDLGTRILRDEIRAGGSVAEGLRRYNAGSNWRQKALRNPSLYGKTDKYAQDVLSTYENYNRRRRTAVSPNAAQQKNVSINQGDVNVNVNVNNTGASAEDISRTTAKRVKEEMDKHNLILSREFGGVY